MYRFLKVSAIMVLITLSVCTQAQDIHFSQFYMSPLNTNPALTGVMNCNTRLVGNYRNQWAGVLGSAAYNTYSVSYDQKVAVGRTDYFGIGGSLWSDVAGSLDFGTTQGRLSFSFSKKMGGYRDQSHFLVFGADAAISQRRLNQDSQAQIWGSQHDGNGGVLPNSTPFVSTTLDYDFIYADLGVGLLWFSILDKRNNFYAGLALAHINKPNVTFQTQGSVIESIGQRLTFHAGGQFEMSNDMTLVPGIVFLKQLSQVELNFGTNVRFDVGSKNSDQSWQIGGWYRLANQYVEPVSGSTESSTNFFHSDAIIFTARFDYDNFGLGFSYDLNVSDLRAASPGNGAFEFSLVYYICGPEKRAIYCPRF
jgi:type IX secretion system PorP/SprF family membrane protein